MYYDSCVQTCISSRFQCHQIDNPVVNEMFTRATRNIIGGAFDPESIYRHVRMKSTKPVPLSRRYLVNSLFRCMYSKHHILVIIRKLKKHWVRYSSYSRTAAHQRWPLIFRNIIFGTNFEVWRREMLFRCRPQPNPHPASPWPLLLLSLVVR